MERTVLGTARIVAPVEVEAIRQEQERTTIKKRMFLEMLESSGGKAFAVAKNLEIGYSTYHYWKKTDPEFKRKVSSILEMRPYFVEESLLNQALQGDVPAAKYILSHTHPDYKQKKKKGENQIHIYHHTDAKPEKGESRTLEDIISESAVRTMLLVQQGHLPHVHDTADMIRVLESLPPEKRAELEAKVKKEMRYNDG